MKTLQQGTPKFLEQAIRNALLEYHGPTPIDPKLQDLIEAHVKDFLAQKFQIAVCKATDLLQLFDESTRRKS